MGVPLRSNCIIVRTMKLLGLILPLVFADTSNFLDKQESSNVLLNQHTRQAGKGKGKWRSLISRKLRKPTRECTQKRCGHEEFQESFENAVSKAAKRCLNDPFNEPKWLIIFKQYYTNCICKQGDQRNQCQGTRQSRGPCVQGLLRAYDDALTDSNGALRMCHQPACAERSNGKGKANGKGGKRKCS